MSYTIIKDPVLEPFYLSKDQYCYTVYENVTPDPANLEEGSKGKDYQKALGYYTKLSHALQAVPYQMSGILQHAQSMLTTWGRSSALRY